MAHSSRPNYITGWWIALTLACVYGQLVLQPQNYKHITRTRRQLAPNINVHDIPKTSFSCDDKKLGEYYADPETDCQVYHICLPSTGPRLHAMSFVCPNGTIFSQASRVCNLYDRVFCDIASRYYETLHGNLHSRRDDYGDPNDYSNSPRLPQGPQRPRSQNALEDPDSDDYEDDITTRAPSSTQRSRSNRNRQNSRNRNPPPPPNTPPPPPPPAVRPPAIRPPPARSFRPPPVFRQPPPPTTTEQPQTTTSTQAPRRSFFPVNRLPNLGSPAGLRNSRPAEEAESTQTAAAPGPGFPPVPIALRPPGFRPPAAALHPAPGASRPAPAVTRPPTTTSAPVTTATSSTTGGGQPYEYDYELDYTYDYPPNTGARIAPATRTRRAAAPSKKGGRYPSVVDTSRPHINTNFTCQGKLSGFVYADMETECEMFHICVPVGKGKLFDYRLFCAPGTAFNQRSGICENKLTFDCFRTEKYYRHDKIGRYFSGLKPEYDQKKSTRVQREVEDTTVTPTTSAPIPLPQTRFSCEGKTVGGYYADPDTGCQMFHICAPVDNGRSIDLKFLCSNGTVFNQKTLVCDQDGQVACSKSESYFVNSFTRFLEQERRTADELKRPIYETKIELYRKERT